MLHPIRRLTRQVFSSSTARRVLMIAVPALALPAAAFAAQRLAQHTTPMAGRVVYNRAAAGVWDAYTSDPNGANEIQITNTKDVDINRSTAGEQQTRWSADGQDIAFTTYERTGERMTIWSMPFAGGTPTPLVQGDKGWGSPAWQRPSGRCIVYSGERPSATDRLTDLLIKCPDQAARRVVDTADMDEDGPDWKPDGSQIVYEARPAGLENIEKKLWDLWVVNPDGSGRERLLDEPNTAERQPRWSPDGQQIAFVTYGPAGFGKGILKTLDLATGAVSSHVEGVAGPMAWSPDGQHILFYNTWDLGPKPIAAQASPAQGQVKGLYMLNPETHEITRLLPPAGGEQANDDPPSFEWGYAPDWTAGTYTPTPLASPTATATTPAPTASPTDTSTPSPTATPGDEFTPTPQATVDPSPDIYLPIAYKP